MIQVRGTEHNQVIEVRLNRHELILLKEAVEQAIVSGAGLYSPRSAVPPAYVKVVRLD